MDGGVQGLEAISTSTSFSGLPIVYISMCCIFHQLVTLSLRLDNNQSKLFRVHRWRWHVTKLIRDLICLKYYIDKYFSDFSYVCFFLKKYSIRKLINLNVSSLVFKFNLYIKNIFNYKNFINNNLFIISFNNFNKHYLLITTFTIIFMATVNKKIHVLQGNLIWWGV